MSIFKLLGTHLHHKNAVISTGDDPDALEGGTTSIIKEFVNNSGGNLVLGDVVRIDTSGDRLVTKTSLAAGDVLGVVAAAGPYANAAVVPVTLEGYHPAVKVTGVVSRGDYLFGSVTSGVATASATPDEGAFARVVSDDVAGFAAVVVFDKTLGAGGAANFIELLDVPTSYVDQTGKLVAVNAGATALEFVSGYVAPTDVLWDASGITDGVVATFVTPDFFYEDSTRVFLNGLLQRPIIDYLESVTLDGIVCVAAPAVDDELLIEYKATEI